MDLEPRTMSPLARRAFHPDTVQRWAGALLSTITLYAPVLDRGGAVTVAAAALLVAPISLLFTRDYKPMGTSALVATLVAIATTALYFVVPASGAG